MNRRIVFETALILLLVSALIFVFNISILSASGTVYIRADGSIDPPSANITSADNVTYTLTGNVNDYIVVQRNNILINGSACRVEGTGSGTGIDLNGRSNVTITNMEIKAFLYGVWLTSSSNNIIIGNNVTGNNGDGIRIETYSSSNCISENNVTANFVNINLVNANYNNVSKNRIASSSTNGYGIVSSWSNYNNVFENDIVGNANGIRLYSSSNHNIYHNNFKSNGNQVYIYSSVNVWDNGYPSGGNYFSSYGGIDVYSGPYQNETGIDGIGDTAYVFDANNRDNYPLMKSWPWTHNVAITNITSSVPEAYAGQTVDISVVTRNLGDAPKHTTLQLTMTTFLLEPKTFPD